MCKQSLGHVQTVQVDGKIHINRLKLLPERVFFLVFLTISFESLIYIMKSMPFQFKY